MRNISQVQDYTNYARGVYADYYQCHGAEPANGLASTCFSPSATWNETERNTHQSHEFRLSTPDDWRLRGIVGAFWEELQIEDQLNWLYKTLPACTDTRHRRMFDGHRDRSGLDRRSIRHAQRQCRVLQRRHSAAIGRRRFSPRWISISFPKC